MWGMTGWKPEDPLWRLNSRLEMDLQETLALGCFKAGGLMWMVTSLSASLCKACTSPHSQCSHSGLELLDLPIRELQSENMDLLPTTYTTLWEWEKCAHALQPLPHGLVCSEHRLDFCPNSPPPGTPLHSNLHNNTGQWPFLFLLQRAQITQGNLSIPVLKTAHRILSTNQVWV